MQSSDWCMNMARFLSVAVVFIAPVLKVNATGFYRKVEKSVAREA